MGKLITSFVSLEDSWIVLVFPATVLKLLSLQFTGSELNRICGAHRNIPETPNHKTLCEQFSLEPLSSDDTVPLGLFRSLTNNLSNIEHHLNPSCLSGRQMLSKSHYRFIQMLLKAK